MSNSKRKLDNKNHTNDNDDNKKRKINHTYDNNNSEINITQLTTKQLIIYNKAVNERLSLFYTGEAGTGKTTLLKKIIDGLKGRIKNSKRSVFVTASTGIAALNINGNTLHSYVGVGIISNEKSLTTSVTLYDKLKRKKYVKDRIKNTKVLIIDELSMVTKDYFRLIEDLFRRVRGNDKIFGGVQIIATGDFYQLPPVIEKNNYNNEKEYVFECEFFQKLFGRNQYPLDIIFRQKDDDEFIECLRALRNSTKEKTIDKKYIDLLNTRYNAKLTLKEDEKPTLIRPTNIEVDKINLDELKKIDGVEYVFNSIDTGNDISKLKNCMAPKKLILKIGAQVMLLKNLDVEYGLVNGLKGVVVNIEKGFPIVYFDKINVNVKILKYELKMENGNYLIAKRIQFPLKLAYGITIHKSQGLTIENIDVDLTRVFGSGQVYTALSRAVSLNGLRLNRKIDPSKIATDQKVIDYYNKKITNENFSG